MFISELSPGHLRLVGFVVAMDILPPHTASITTIFNDVAATLGLDSWNAMRGPLLWARPPPMMDRRADANRHVTIRGDAALSRGARGGKNCQPRGQSWRQTLPAVTQNNAPVRLLLEVGGLVLAASLQERLGPGAPVELDPPGLDQGRFAWGWGRVQRCWWIRGPPDLPVQKLMTPAVRLLGDPVPLQGGCGHSGAALKRVQGGTGSGPPSLCLRRNHAEEGQTCVW